MDNYTRDNSPRPDPPGSSDFVFQRYIDANLDGGMGTLSTLTNPPPIQSPFDQHRLSCTSVPNISTNSSPIVLSEKLRMTYWLLTEEERRK